MVAYHRQHVDTLDFRRQRRGSNGVAAIRDFLSDMRFRGGDDGFDDTMGPMRVPYIHSSRQRF
jgi:hypothetical protein